MALYCDNASKRKIYLGDGLKTVKFNPINGIPNWLCEDRDLSHCTNQKKTELQNKRQRKIFTATPPWYSEEHHKQIKQIYKERDKLRSLGYDVHVDHIVPICSDYVCGLNVPWNYQILDAKENIIKNNLEWPNMHKEQVEIEIDNVPHQMKLL